MPGINSVTIVGNLGKDPEIRTTQSGKSIANLTIATSETWKDKASGEKKERTEWHRVTCYNEGLTSNVIEPYLKKGSKVGIVNASLATKKWQDKDGHDRYTTEIEIGPFKGELHLMGDSSGGKREDYQGPGGGGGSDAKPRQQTAQPRREPGHVNTPAQDLDDDIPF